MSKKKIDLSDIKTNDLEETSSFTDLMTRKERLHRNDNIIESDDIDDMINERRRNTEELAKDLRKAQEEYNRSLNEEKKLESRTEKRKKEEEIEENLGKTQIMELTRQMKFNFEEKKEENNKKKKHGISSLNLVGELSLICMGYYIYLLAFTNYQDIEIRYMINGGIIVSMVLFFGLSVVTNKKLSKFFHILNILVVIGFICYNAYTLIY